MNSKNQEAEKEYVKREVWKEYTGKANNFADWFTAIIISNFAYLISLLKPDDGLQFLKDKPCLWNSSFSFTCAALICIFFVKVLGVWAASIRVDREICKQEKQIIELSQEQEITEETRTILSWAFVFGGIFSLYITLCILTHIISTHFRQ